MRCAAPSTDETSLDFCFQRRASERRITCQRHTLEIDACLALRAIEFKCDAQRGFAIDGGLQLRRPVQARRLGQVGDQDRPTGQRDRISLRFKTTR